MNYPAEYIIKTVNETQALLAYFNTDFEGLKRVTETLKTQTRIEMPVQEAPDFIQGSSLSSLISSTITRHSDPHVTFLNSLAHVGVIAKPFRLAEHELMLTDAAYLGFQKDSSSYYIAEIFDTNFCHAVLFRKNGEVVISSFPTAEQMYHSPLFEQARKNVNQWANAMVTIHVGPHDPELVNDHPVFNCNNLEEVCEVIRSMSGSTEMAEGQSVK